MLKRFATTIAALTLVMGMSGCTPADADKADLVKALKEDGVSDTEAKCIADALFDDKYADDQKTLNEIASAEDESDLPKEVRDAIDDAIAACKQ